MRVLHRIRIVLVCAIAQCGAVCFAGYPEFVAQYSGQSMVAPFPNGDQNSPTDLRLIVTETDAMDGRFGNPGMQNVALGMAKGFELSMDGRIVFFARTPANESRRGYLELEKSKLDRIVAVVAALPDDHGWLPPPGRRLVVQARVGDRQVVRVYDRGNLPDSILEMLRISGSGISPWAPRFQASGQIALAPLTDVRAFALAPDGEMACGGGKDGRTIELLDSDTRAPLKAIGLPENVSADQIVFSPDGTLAVIAGGADCEIADAMSWQPITILHGQNLQNPLFSADGRCLMFRSQRNLNDPNGRAAGLTAFDTQTWQAIDELPGYSSDIIDAAEAIQCGAAVVSTADNTMELWDRASHAAYATLEKNVRWSEVAFSPDASKVAIAYTDLTEAVGAYQIGVWRLSDGKLLYQIPVFDDKPCEQVDGLQWTLNGQFVLAMCSAPGMRQHQIRIWDADHGRLRGMFTEMIADASGPILLPDGKTLAAVGDGAMIVGPVFRRIRMMNGAVINGGPMRGPVIVKGPMIVNGGVIVNGNMANMPAPAAQVIFWDLSTALNQIHQVANSFSSGQGN